MSFTGSIKRNQLDLLEDKVVSLLYTCKDNNSFMFYICNKKKVFIVIAGYSCSQWNTNKEAFRGRDVERNGINCRFDESGCQVNGS